MYGLSIVLTHRVFVLCFQISCSVEYSYLILDSEATSSLQLEHFLEDYTDFMCLGKATTGDDGLNAILKYLPDVVFVRLNDQAYEYFQMVTELYQYIKQLPIFIGISKTKEHAYEAIKHNFYDYWLMPYNEFGIRKSIFKLRNYLPAEREPTTLVLKSYKDYHYLDTSEILYLKADNNATDFFMRDGSRISAFKTLKSFEKQLPQNFIRIHQSYILNTRYVSRINYGKSICFLRNTTTHLPFSRSYKENVDDLKALLSKNTISASN